jgi:hypothetical protein
VIGPDRVLPATAAPSWSRNKRCDRGTRAGGIINKKRVTTVLLLLPLTQRGGQRCCCLYPKEVGGDGIAAAAAKIIGLNFFVGFLYSAAAISGAPRVTAQFLAAPSFLP